MEERGLLDAMKEGAVPGTCIGFAVAASRAYLDSRGFAQRSEAITTAAAQAKPSLSPRELRALRPTPLPGLFLTTFAYGALGGVYMGVGHISENMRGKKDLWNGVLGGLAAGSLVGVRSGSMYASGGAMAALAAMSAVMDLLNGEFGPKNQTILERRRALYRE